MTHDNRILLHMSLIQGVGPVSIRRVRDRCVAQQISYAEIYRCSSADFHHQYGLTQAVSRALFSGLAQQNKLDEELVLLQKHGYVWVSEHDEAYPALLREIAVPPVGLYVHGDVQVLHQLAISLVGSRAADAYGSSNAQRCAEAMARSGVVTVSGGARGIDALVHQHTLVHGGRTVAVLGSGLLRPYPLQHRDLFAQIASHGGAVISTFPLCESARGHHFPQRNRVIAGLSLATVVLQAAARSGALITAQYALDFGREVGAVPGDIRAPLSAGCHALIKQGAALINSPDDLYALLPHRALLSKRAVGGVAEGTWTLPACAKTGDASEDRPVRVAPQKAPDGICHLLTRPCSFDELVAATALAPTDLHTRLHRLQLSGKIIQNFAGLWQLA